MLNKFFFFDNLGGFIINYESPNKGEYTRIQTTLHLNPITYAKRTRSRKLRFQWSQAMNSPLLLNPCFASASATMFVPLLLWITETICSLDIAFLMKLIINVKFQGPSRLPLHQFTAFAESDSIMILLLENMSSRDEIYKARWIASTSTWFISMKGRGREKIHRNFPELSRKTPPVAEHDEDDLVDASTFHFKELKGAGDHWFDAYDGEHAFFRLLFTPHVRQYGFLRISLEL